MHKIITEDQQYGHGAKELSQLTVGTLKWLWSPICQPTVSKHWRRVV